MAIGNTTTPPQTAGMKAASGLANGGGNKLKAYMSARGAKPPESTGMTGGGTRPPTPAPKPGVAAGSPGNLGKGRRMTGKPISSANKVGRAASQFSGSNTVPTGGRGAGSGGLGQLGVKFGQGGGGRGTAGRVDAFLAQRKENGGGRPDGPPDPSPGVMPRRHPPLPGAGGAPGPRGAPAKPVAKTGAGMTGVGASLGVNTGGPDPKALGAARGAMSKPPTTQPSPPVRGGPQTMGAPRSRPPLLSNGAPSGGGASIQNPPRQRPSSS